MNIKLTVLTAVSALGLGTAVFAESIECPKNYWCELPVKTTAEVSLDILSGEGWRTSVVGDRAFVMPTDYIDTSVIIPVEAGATVFELKVAKNPAWDRLEAIMDEQ